MLLDSSRVASFTELVSMPTKLATFAGWKTGNEMRGIGGAVEKVQRAGQVLDVMLSTPVQYELRLPHQPHLS